MKVIPCRENWIDHFHLNYYPGGYPRFNNQHVVIFCNPARYDDLEVAQREAARLLAEIDPSLKMSNFKLHERQTHTDFHSTYVWALVYTATVESAL